jgi:hypothetical protein
LLSFPPREQQLAWGFGLLESNAGLAISAAANAPDLFVVGANPDRNTVGGFADVSPANMTVTVLAKYGEQTVARRPVYVRENWLTSVVLRPLSGDE